MMGNNAFHLVVVVRKETLYNDKMLRNPNEIGEEIADLNSFIS